MYNIGYQLNKITFPRSIFNHRLDVLVQLLQARFKGDIGRGEGSDASY